jgi:thioredoxin-related protein
MTKLTRPLAALLLLAVPAIARGQENVIKTETKAEAKKQAKPAIYDIKKDAREQIKVATAKARRDNRRVLVMFGFETCGWCHKLHELFASDKAIRQILSDEYVLAMVDIKAPNADSLLAECTGDLTGVGYPFLAVLDGDGKVVTRQKTDPLEEGDHHDPAKVKAFLAKWTATKQSAAKVLADGLARASSEDKRVFLHFGAPWCGWCHKLEDFLARPDMAAIIGRDFVDVKLDNDRMDGAREIFAKYNSNHEKSGIPWFVFVDAKGEAIVNSDGPKGNIGYPFAPEEIAHFMGMLRKTVRKIEPAQVEAIEQALKSEAAKIEAARPAPARPAAQ